MIPTLVSTVTLDDDTGAEFTLNSDYDHYMFVIIDFNPGTDDKYMRFNASTDGGSNYDQTKTTTYFHANHNESGSSSNLNYETGRDMPEQPGAQQITDGIGNEADSSANGIIHLYNPSNTTYTKNVFSRIVHMDAGGTTAVVDTHVGGYFNVTNDLDKFIIQIYGGNATGVIQMYGIA